MLGSIGTTMILLACALPTYNVWWPLFVVIFYILCPVPTMIAKRIQDGDDGVRPNNAMFATIGIVLSSFALPIVLARAGVIQWGAGILTLAGNAVAYTSLLAYHFGFESGDPSMW
ncbi:leptin receptor gene-related protein [Anopheles aquasalis]|uniref:leptin receptor gene-related protein n=1 Tax=Anopheles aquasalis TaxID=42839 RepID=UPI00215A45BC|nr:leptin receptor gene-related protein [Anopheles aquasalis]